VTSTYRCLSVWYRGARSLQFSSSHSSLHLYFPALTLAQFTLPTHRLDKNLYSNAAWNPAQPCNIKYYTDWAGLDWELWLAQSNPPQPYLAIINGQNSRFDVLRFKTRSDWPTNKRAGRTITITRQPTPPHFLSYSILLKISMTNHIRSLHISRVRPKMYFK